MEINSVHESVRQAGIFAHHKHANQVDDNGEDYFTAHVYPVFKAVQSLVPDNQLLQCASLLHDTVEDTDTTLQEIEENFGKHVAEVVEELTHEGKKDEYGFYFPSLKSAGAILIKLCDRASNISRMQSWDKKRRIQYLKRTKFWKDGSDKPRKTARSQAKHSYENRKV